jgi:hypothetical protein
MDSVHKEYDRTRPFSEQTDSQRAMLADEAV